MTTNTNEADPAAAAAQDPANPAAATPAAAVATTTTATQGDGSLLNTNQAATNTGDDWLPEKFRVTGEDGKLDEAASARKLADSYRALEAHKGPLPQAPATPEDYKLESPKDAEGKPLLPDDEFKAFTEDPMLKNLATEAHKLGVSNEQFQFFVGKYLTLAPQLLEANIDLSLAEAKAELSTIWKDEATLTKNCASVVRAINAFGAEAADVPGSRARLFEKYGRDPDFIAFAASVSAELQEDVAPAAGALSSEADVESLVKSEAYWNPKHADHAKVKQQVEAFFTRKHGAKKR